MTVPSPYGSSNSYRYGFGGKEKDDEFKGKGNRHQRLVFTVIVPIQTIN